ncbi:MAG: RNA polymerase sigma-70 factor [Bacteroidota bacterium]
MEKLLTKELSLEEYSNEDLFELVQKKDSYPTFEKLYKRFYSMLISHAFRYMRSTQQADDMVSEVFYKIWKRRSEIKMTSSLQSYLYTSVRNKCLDHLRSESRVEHCDDDVLVDFDAKTATPHQYTVGEELKKRIENAIEALPNDRRRIFRMSRDNGLKYKEIADILGISIKTVETQMGRALKHLRNELSEYM